MCQVRIDDSIGKWVRWKFDRFKFNSVIKQITISTLKINNRERERALLYCIWMKLVLAIGFKHSEIIKKWKWIYTYIVIFQWEYFLFISGISFC